MDLAQVKLWSETITALHKNWQPHEAQNDVIRAIFADMVNSAFIRCGRKWGKTEILIYCLWRIAQAYPGSPCYYFTPQQNQARDIVWTDPRMVTFGPREWLLDGNRGINESTMLLRFKNGSFIKVDGTDNFDRYRGVKYKVAGYDEYKDCDPRMRKAMRPNAAVLGGIDLFSGSPPETSNTDYQTLDEEHQREAGMRAFHEPTWRNPHISKKWLLDEKTKLYRRGDGHEWEREYAAKYVRGGAASIFPMLEETMVKPHEEVMREVHRDRKKLDWFFWHDPAGATCFATLFVAINPYTKKVYLLDEIYEKEQAGMTTKVIGAKAIDIRNELYDRTSAWRGGYDEAATWFLNEYINAFPDEDTLEPSHKAMVKKEAGLALIKDIMLQGLLVISDRCKNFYVEADNYMKDKNGNIPKKNDHLLDNLRYILGAAAYHLEPTAEYREEVDEDFRGESLEQAFYGDNKDPYGLL